MADGGKSATFDDEHGSRCGVGMRSDTAHSIVTNVEIGGRR